MLTGSGLSFLNVVFFGSALLLIGTTAAGFFCILLALWGRAMAYALRPGGWKEKARELREYSSASLASEGHSATSDSVQEHAAQELKRDLLDNLAEATDINVEVNARKYLWLHWGSRFATGGFAALLMSALSYAAIMWGVPPAATAVAARIVEPVVVKSSVQQSEGSMADTKKPSQPPQKPVRPPPPPAELIKDGSKPPKEFPDLKK